jgi:hypothetical protein
MPRPSYYSTPEQAELAEKVNRRTSDRWFYSEKHGRDMFQPCGGCPNGGICATMDSCAHENPEDYR